MIRLLPRLLACSFRFRVLLFDEKNNDPYYRRGSCFNSSSFLYSSSSGVKIFSPRYEPCGVQYPVVAIEVLKNVRGAFF